VDRTVILGAGAAGLAAAWELIDRGAKNVTILERAPLVGGLLSYYEKNNNKYEYGSHVFHTDNEELRARIKHLMGTDLLEFDRGCKLHIKFCNKYFRYPLNGIDIITNLPLYISISCVLSMVYSFFKWKLAGREPSNSTEVLSKHFGHKLYKIFFEDYTHKFWGMPCEKLDRLFALERIPRSDVFKLIHDIFEKLGLGQMFTGHNLTERAIGKLYYCENGIHEIPNKIAALVQERGGKIITNIQLKQILIKDGKAVRIEYSENGSTEVLDVEKIVSTIPIRYLIPLFSPSPNSDILQSASRLKYLPLTVCGLLVKRNPVREAILTYYRDAVYNRLSEPTYHGLQTSPENRSILLAEMTDYTLQEQNLTSNEDIVRKVIEDLVKENLITQEEVEDSCVFRYKEAYPIYHIGFQKDLARIREYLDHLGNVHSTGRQGAFCYVNTHATMQMAISSVREMERRRN
jgi:protoporphyrinogen oxidase